MDLHPVTLPENKCNLKVNQYALNKSSHKILHWCCLHLCLETLQFWLVTFPSVQLCYDSDKQNTQSIKSVITALPTKLHVYVNAVFNYINRRRII